MPVIELPSSLRPLAGHRARVLVEGATAGLALESLVLAAPPLREARFTQAGALKRTVSIFLGDEDLRALQGLATPVTSRSVLVLVSAIAGG